MKIKNPRHSIDVEFMGNNDVDCFNLLSTSILYNFLPTCPIDLFHGRGGH
jgi:hypothetical protein